MRARPICFAVPAGQPRRRNLLLPALVNSVAFRKSAVMNQGRLLLVSVDGADDELVIMDIASVRCWPASRVQDRELTAADARRAVFVEADGKQRPGLRFLQPPKTLLRWTGS